MIGQNLHVHENVTQDLSMQEHFMSMICKQDQLQVDERRLQVIAKGVGQVGKVDLCKPWPLAVAAFRCLNYSGSNGHEIK